MHILGCTTENFEVIQNDISAFSPIKTDNVSQCKKQCVSTPDCLLWTFYGGHCYLKENDTITSAKPGFNVISGFKECNKHGTYLLYPLRDFASLLYNL